MSLLFVEIPIENFTDFFKEAFLKHNKNSQYDYYLHRWNSFQKNYANEVLEISPQNNLNYKFEIVNKKLYSIVKLKFNI